MQLARLTPPQVTPDPGFMVDDAAAVELVRVEDRRVELVTREVATREEDTLEDVRIVDGAELLASLDPQFPLEAWHPVPQ